MLVYSGYNQDRHIYVKRLALFRKVKKPEFLYTTSRIDRVLKKSKFSEWPAEFIVYSRDKYKNFLLTKFLKILQNARAHQQFRQ